jgi:DNA-binding transcriptional regulator YiaG
MLIDNYVVCQHQIKKDEHIMGTVQYTNEQIRKRKGRVDHAKVRAAGEEQIAVWKRADAIDDATLGPIRVVPPVTDVRALRERLALSQEEFAARYMLSTRGCKSGNSVAESRRKPPVCSCMRSPRIPTQSRTCSIRTPPSRGVTRGHRGDVGDRLYAGRSLGRSA